MVLISSPSNPRIRALQHLHTVRGRKKSGLFLMEGLHALEAVLDAGLLPRETYYQPDLLRRTPRGADLLERMLHTLPGETLLEVNERVIEAIGEVQTSQGVVCVLPLEAFAPERIAARRQQRVRLALLILDDLADPGNMGTILRTALAADVDKVLLTQRCVDCFSPKVVRAAVGAHVALPIAPDLSWETIRAYVTAHCANQPRIFLAAADGQQDYYRLNFTQPFALIIGSEAHGPSQSARELASTTITIPLANGVESLNAAIATSVILYESVRQRKKHA